MLNQLLTAFWLGVLTPTGAVCVIALYPGFIAYLSNRANNNPFAISLLVSAGISIFMALLGFIFTFLLDISLTSVIEIISPIGFLILTLVSLLLIFDYDFSRIFPEVKFKSKNPYLEAFGFGFFFGVIVLPCNPAFIVALFATNITVLGFVERLLNFLAFGLGMAFPLVLLSFLSSTKSKQIIHYLVENKRFINLVSGIIMLVISMYYLLFVFQVF